MMPKGHNRGDPHAPFKAARHPQFDEYWAKHRRLVFWWANRLAMIFNRPLRKRRWLQGVVIDEDL